MTDGYPYQLSQRSVVGTGAAKTEVKDAEDHYAWSTVNIVADVEPAVMALKGLEGDATSRHWRSGRGRKDESGLVLHQQMRP